MKRSKFVPVLIPCLAAAVLATLGTPSLSAADTTAPTIASAGTFVTRDGIVLNFSEPITIGLGTAANYTVSGGATVQSATPVGTSSVLLRTSPLTAGTSYTVTANGLRDAAAGGGNALTPNTVSVKC